MLTGAIACSPEPFWLKQPRHLRWFRRRRQVALRLHSRQTTRRPHQEDAHGIEALHLRLLAVQNDLETAREKLRASSMAPAGRDVFTSQLDIRTRPELVAS